MMEMVSVTSSNLSAVGYDEAKHWLVVQFKNGSRYRYVQVPYQLFEGLMNASSKGTFFNQKIRDRFRYVKL
jgi:hypothetical protein